MLHFEHVNVHATVSAERGRFLGAGKAELQPNFDLKSKTLSEKFVLSLTVGGPDATCRV